MQSSHLLVINDMVAQLPPRQPEILQQHEESSGPSTDPDSAAGLLDRLSLFHQDYRDWIGDVQNLELPEGVTLDDVLDAVVGLSVAYAIEKGRDPSSGYGLKI